MENYRNVEGASGGSTGADIGGALGGALISGVVGGLFAKGEAKKARQLQEQLAKLSLAQHLELDERLQDVKAETERNS